MRSGSSLGQGRQIRTMSSLSERILQAARVVEDLFRELCDPDRVEGDEVDELESILENDELAELIKMSV